MAKLAKPKDAAQTRNPERTRERILSAALKEFSAKGFAGARVDGIARRASINKRMLYHYFSNKENLFRAVLRHKILERRTLVEGAPGDPVEYLPFRFDMMCRDMDWVRLLAWESLQSPGDKIVEEKFRREGNTRALNRVRLQQAQGQLTADFGAPHLLLAKLSLVMFPAAFPQLVRLITGLSVHDLEFQREYRGFLRKIALVFRPGRSTPVKIEVEK